MEINFVDILPRTGLARVALFQVGDKEIKIGISDSLLAVWGVQKIDKMVAKLLQQIGAIKIYWMLTEGNLQDYTFQTYDFKKIDGTTMSLSEADDFLKEKVSEAEDEKSRIGFKSN